MVVDAIDDHAAASYRHFEFDELDDRRLWRRLADVAPRAPVGGQTAGAPRPKGAKLLGSPAQLCAFWAVWWQWTIWPRGVMGDIGKTARPDVLVAGGWDLDLLLGPLVAYLRALEARVGALERRLSAVPLMTAADAARYARVNVETILRAVRAGELPVAGYVGRSPRISRDALVGWLETRSPPVPPVARQPRRHRGRKARDPRRRDAGRRGPADHVGHRARRRRPRRRGRRHRARTADLLSGRLRRHAAG